MEECVDEAVAVAQKAVGPRTSSRSLCCLTIDCQPVCSWNN